MEKKIREKKNKKKIFFFSFSQILMGYLTKLAIENIRKYKYNGQDKSFTSKYLLQPYWNFVLRFVPLWMA